VSLYPQNTTTLHNTIFFLQTTTTTGGGGEMMIRDNIRVLLREPGSAQPILKSFQDRLFFEYRNKNFGVFLQRDGPTNTTSTTTVVKRQPPPPPPHGLIMETFSQMRAIQHPSIGNATPLVFDIGNRPSYHIPTYQTFLGIVADPHEPFHHWTEAKNHKDFYQHLSHSDREWISAWAKETYGGGSRSGAATNVTSMRPIFTFSEQQLRLDCVIIGKDCAALVTSCNELTEQLLLNFAGLGHLTYAFLGRCQHERYKTNWGKFYEPRAFPPKLYVGVGASEFGNGDVPVDSPELCAMAQRVATNVGATTRIGASSVISVPLRTLARQLGITLLQRHEMRYFVVRE
jgi:hypothetical protein